MSNTNNLKSDSIFTAIKEILPTKGEEFVKKVNGTILFQIKNPEGFYLLDLKNDKGNLYIGKKEIENKSPDITISIQDEDFHSMAQGKLNAQQAFMRGKLKIKGNMALAMKLNIVLDAAKPKSKL